MFHGLNTLPPVLLQILRTFEMQVRSCQLFITENEISKYATQKQFPQQNPVFEKKSNYNFLIFNIWMTINSSWTDFWGRRLKEKQS